VQGIADPNQVIAQRALAGADLTENLTGLQIDAVNNTPDYPGIVEKVLAESFSRSGQGGLVRIHWITVLPALRH
jgi:hypothetical protein